MPQLLHPLLVSLPAHQVMDDVCANVVVDLVEDAIVTVQAGQPTTQVGPLLATVPGHLLLWVVAAVVVQVGLQGHLGVGGAWLLYPSDAAEEREG